MAADTTMLHVRLASDLKAYATQSLAAMGLTTADGVRLFFHRVVAEQAFPLELKVLNAETRAAIYEANLILANLTARFPNAQAMFDALNDET